MGLGTHISTGLNTLTFGVLGERQPEVRTFIVHPDGTKSEESGFKEASDYRVDQGIGLGFAVLGATAAIGGVEALRSFATSARSANGLLSGIQRFFATGAAQAGLRALSVSVGGLAVAGAAGHLFEAIDNPVPGMDLVSNRFKSETVLEVYHDEAGNWIGTEEVPRETYESERKAAEEALGIDDW